MDGDGDNSRPQHNLNDLQNLLVSFNREIEDQPGIPTPTIVTANPVFLESADGESVSEGTVEVSTSQPYTGFYTETHGMLESMQGNKPQITSIISTSNEIQNVSIAPESSITSTTEIKDDDNLPGQNVSIKGLQSQNLACLNQATGNVLRIVSIGNDGQMHIVTEDQLQHESEISALSAEQLEEQVVENTEDDQHQIIDGTDPVAVLASVAANTSSVSHLQTVNIHASDIHNPQLVALQNSADSSQPQLVAMQNGDVAASEAVQIIGGSEAATINQALFPGPNNSFQTVTLVPSETGPGGEVSYMLIMSPPDGENGDTTAKAISLDMSVYDFKEEAREITEEIIEEDGKMRRIVRITPKNNFIGNGQLMCTYCNYTSPKRYLLTRHMKTHSEDRPHKCHICERGFKTLASLTNHVNTHTGIRPHKCKLCESAFTTSGELVRHVRYKHTFEKPHKCSMCEYASVELSKLKRHMRSHTGERPYQCPHCDYASPDTYKLKRHLRIHTGEKPYECNVCHARFTQSNSLKAHKLIHTGTKPVFQCEHCPTTCGRRTDLKIHIQKLHMSEHPLLCRKCGEHFPDRYTYKIHIKSHEGEKCFKCNTCGHAALSQRHLESHQLIHTGEKPYECGNCEHSFRQKQLLKRHQNLHHNSNVEYSSSKTDFSDCNKGETGKGILDQQLMNVGANDEESGEGESLNSIITQNILEKNLLQEWRDGKLGNAQQVVIVHPDGTVEEVTHKLQAPQQSTSADLQDVNPNFEQLEDKSDISQLVIKQEPITEEEQNEDVLDETKEAGTQAEIESDGEEGKKTAVVVMDNINILTTPPMCSTSEIDTLSTPDQGISSTPKILVTSTLITSMNETSSDGVNADYIDCKDRDNRQLIDPLPEQIDRVSLPKEMYDDPPSETNIDCANTIQAQTAADVRQNLVMPQSERKTRSMKRKEEDYSKSPAKRTRSTTLDHH